MIPYTAYKVIHLTGIFMLLVSLGGLLLIRINGGELSPRARKLSGMNHGIGALLIVLGGFGMVARLALPWPFPLWMWAKVVIWLLLSGEIALILRKPKLASQLWWGTLALAVCATWLATSHPFESL